jgi:hypothetical protein
MLGALLYLRLVSLRNLVVQRILRLRQPKYLVGTVVAVAYFYFILMHRNGPMGPASAMASQAGAGAGAIAAALTCGGLCLLALVRIAFAWIAPAENPGLRFSEPEIAFLFPAPMSRRALIHFRLLSSQLAILFTSVLIAVLFNRSGYVGGNRAIRAVGWWVILSTFDLHMNGTKLTLARLRETSSHFLLWRLAAVTAICLYVLAVFRSGSALVMAYVSGPEAAQASPGAFVGELVDSPVFHWLTLPFRIVLAPYFARDMQAFALAVAPALLFLALHYYWVCSSQAHFEEGSIALAEKRSAAKAAALRGESPRIGTARPKTLPGPFPLAPLGPPEVAFLWKNLLSMRSSLFGRRALMIVVMLTVWAGAALGPLLAGHARSSGSDPYSPLIVAFSLMIAIYTVLLGPQVARQDLRGDLANADILKTYPVEGWRIALGELLAPTCILSLVLWIAIIAAAAALDPTGRIAWLTRGVRLTAGLSAAVAAPLLCLIQLIVPNTAMVLFPGWYQASRTRGGGIELVGQRLIFGVVQLVFALLVTIPAAGAAFLVIFSSQWILGVGPAIVLAALAVVAIMASEAVVGVWWLGERFDRFDLSAETR